MDTDSSYDHSSWNNRISHNLKKTKKKFVMKFFTFKPLSFRKVLLFITVFFVVVVVFLYFFTVFQNNSSKSLRDQLSLRAKEFIENQRSDSSSMWYKRGNGNSKEMFQKDDSVVDSICFQVAIPFKHTSSKMTETPEQCVLRATMIAPVGVMVITMSSDKNQTLNEDSGVNMRIRDPKMYTQEFSKIEGFSEQYQFSSEDSLLTFLRKDGKKIVIAFSNIHGGVTPEYFTLTRELLKSIQLKSLPTPTPTPNPTPSPTPNI